MLETAKLRGANYGDVRVRDIRHRDLSTSLLEKLSNVEMMGVTVRATREELFALLVPPMKVRNVNFFEVPKF